jgi:hypothetical protein
VREDRHLAEARDHERLVAAHVIEVVVRGEDADQAQAFARERRGHAGSTSEGSTTTASTRTTAGREQR